MVDVRVSIPVGRSRSFNSRSVVSSDRCGVCCSFLVRHSQPSSSISFGKTGKTHRYVFNSTQASTQQYYYYTFKAGYVGTTFCFGFPFFFFRGFRYCVNHMVPVASYLFLTLFLSLVFFPLLPSAHTRRTEPRPRPLVFPSHRRRAGVPRPRLRQRPRHRHGLPGR